MAPQHADVAAAFHHVIDHHIRHPHIRANHTRADHIRANHLRFGHIRAEQMRRSTDPLCTVAQWRRAEIRP